MPSPITSRLSESANASIARTTAALARGQQPQGLKVANTQQLAQEGLTRADLARLNLAARFHTLP